MTILSQHETPKQVLVPNRAFHRPKPTKPSPEKQEMFNLWNPNSTPQDALGASRDLPGEPWAPLVIPGASLGIHRATPGNPVPQASSSLEFH